MRNCVASLLCVAAFVATTFARPSSHIADIDEAARLYAELHPNTGTGSPEYGQYWEGDIVVADESERHRESNPLNAVTNPDWYWPNGIVYYTILTDGYNSDQINQIEVALNDIEERTRVNGQTCVQFIPRQSESNYVYVENYSGCSSWMGRIGGAQQLSLVNGCFWHGTIIHEFLHALGFYHEQSRYDRDDWIAINWGNIQPGMEYNFEMASPSDINLLGTPYDYGSVMHYDAYAFAVDTSVPTIIPHDPNAFIGQRDGMSALDIERVQIYYGCLNAEDSRFFKHLAQK